MLLSSYNSNIRYQHFSIIIIFVRDLFVKFFFPTNNFTLVVKFLPHKVSCWNIYILSIKRTQNDFIFQFCDKVVGKSGGSLSLLESHRNFRWRLSWAGKRSGLKRSLSFTGEWFPPGRSHSHCHRTAACPAVDVDQYPNGEQESESPVSVQQSVAKRTKGNLLSSSFPKRFYSLSSLTGL